MGDFPQVELVSAEDEGVRLPVLYELENRLDGLHRVDRFVMAGGETFLPVVNVEESDEASFGRDTEGFLLAASP